jgi:hypothetical protein
MLYWECKRRVGELRQFREVVRSYFRNTAFDTMGRRHAVTDLSELRTKINIMIPEVVRSSYKIGHSLSVNYNHPRYGISGRINVIENLFSLDRQQIPVSKAFDYIDRVIGEYDRQLATLKKQSWNPLYWLRLGFLAVIGLPFRILGAAGFNAQALEQTVAGRIVKATVGFVIFLAALLQVLSLLGLPTGWRDLVRLVHHK